jgi:hypothetical protein
MPASQSSLPVFDFRLLIPLFSSLFADHCFHGNCFTLPSRNLLSKITDFSSMLLSLIPKDSDLLSLLLDLLLKLSFPLLCLPTFLP